ncbi:Hypothetical_protein [Hexamita inflata]|nr:Hypothetical protein HINF_LOCUS14749 [Hexamita inflata]
MEVYALNDTMNGTISDIQYIIDLYTSVQSHSRRTPLLRPSRPLTATSTSATLLIPIYSPIYAQNKQFPVIGVHPDTSKKLSQNDIKIVKSLLSRGVAVAGSMLAAPEVIYIY